MDWLALFPYICEGNDDAGLPDAENETARYSTAEAGIIMDGRWMIGCCWGLLAKSIGSVECCNARGSNQ